MKKISSLLFRLHLFVGVGAIFGGGGAILDPVAPLGIKASEVLKNAPFETFLIPGIILFVIIGLGNIFSAVTMHYKSRFQGYISSIFSWGLVIWIVVQCIMLNAVAALHIIFFAIGLIQAILSMIILFSQKLFPANLVLGYYEKMKKDI